MQHITISRILMSDAVRCRDKNGNCYTIFTVICGELDINGRVEYTFYHCTCYIAGFEELKKGDQVFVAWKLCARISTAKDGKSYLNLNVMVYQASGGYKIEERKKVKACFMANLNTFYVASPKYACVFANNTLSLRYTT